MANKPQSCPHNDNGKVKDTCNTSGTPTVDKNHSDGDHLWQILLMSGGSTRGNFGMKGHAAAVFLPSKDLK